MRTYDLPDEYYLTSEELDLKNEEEYKDYFIVLEKAQKVIKEKFDFEIESFEYTLDRDRDKTKILGIFIRDIDWILDF